MTVGVREPFKARQRVADAIKERQPILCCHPQQLSELGPVMSLCVRSGLSKTSQILPEHVRTSCSVIGTTSSSLNHKTSRNNTFSVRKKSSRVKKTYLGRMLVCTLVCFITGCSNFWILYLSISISCSLLHLFDAFR